MKPEISTVALSKIIFDEKVYPRQKHDPVLVQRYADAIESIELKQNYICISQDFRLVDGRHRQLAYKTVFSEDREIPVYIYPVSDNDDVFDLAVELNSYSGWQMTDDDKRRAAAKMYARADRKPQDDIAKILGVSIKKVNIWLSDILKQERTEREEKIYNLWMACYETDIIADTVKQTPQAVNQFLQKKKEDFQEKDSFFFRNFEPQVYTVWNFAKATNEVRHFGNIPPEIIDNLMYYYTKPFDVVFDPFGGGGSTIDKCLERNRRYYVSDLNPIPARSDIRKWDIGQGLPNDLPVPDLVFLDPPYWKQAEGKYSDQSEDLANMELDKFLSTIGDIARNIKRKWSGNRPDGKLAIIIGPYQKDWKTIDLPFMCYQTIVKYLNPVIRIQVPYSTQVHGGQYVQNAKNAKQMLYLSRDLMVFEG